MKKKLKKFLKIIFEYILQLIKDQYYNIFDLFQKDNQEDSLVPNVLFTSYCCSEDDQIIYLILNKWRKLNSNFKIKYFSDKDLEIFFNNHKEYKTTFLKLKNGAAKADFFRIVYLNKYGGYWFDIDLEPFKVIKPKKGSIHLFDMGYKNISYMFIGGVKNQLFSEVIKNVSINITNNFPIKNQHILNITGPRIIQEIISRKLNFDLVDGNFPGKIKSKTYLQNTDFEFEYMRQRNKNTKSNLYFKLQDKYKKKNCSDYDYI